MKLRVDRAEFGKAVAWAARSLPSRPTLPVLSGAVLTASGDKLTVSGYDQDISNEADIDVTADDSGSVVVPGRMLSEIVKALPDQPVTIAVEAARAVLSCGDGRFRMPIMPIEDYPATPTMPAAVGTVDATGFATAVAQTAVAAGHDEVLPMMTGVQLELADSITMWATDRYRIATTELTWRPSSSATSVTALVPARTLASAAKTLPTAATEIAIAVSDPSGPNHLIGFAAGPLRTTTRVLDGQLPDLRAQLARDFDARIAIGTAALSEVAHRVSLVSTRQTKLTLTAEADRVVIEADDGDTDAAEAVKCRYAGPPLRLSFQATYLRDGLSAVRAPISVLSVDANRQRVLLTGAKTLDDDHGDDRRFRYLLVPLRR
ncbi:MAG: DNA polymerase III subunit beta [Stackebrandtia sp.]